MRATYTRLASEYSGSRRLSWPSVMQAGAWRGLPFAVTAVEPRGTTFTWYNGRPQNPRVAMPPWEKNASGALLAPVSIMSIPKPSFRGLGAGAPAPGALAAPTRKVRVRHVFLSVHVGFRARGVFQLNVSVARANGPSPPDCPIAFTTCATPPPRRCSCAAQIWPPCRTAERPFRTPPGRAR